jgi:hypothetical protein
LIKSEGSSFVAFAHASQAYTRIEDKHCNDIDVEVEQAPLMFI